MCGSRPWHKKLPYIRRNICVTSNREEVLSNGGTESVLTSQASIFADLALAFPSLLYISQITGLCSNKNQVYSSLVASAEFRGGRHTWREILTDCTSPSRWREKSLTHQAIVAVRSTSGVGGIRRGNSVIPFPAELLLP